MSAANKNRLEYYDEYPMPDYDGMPRCPASRRRRRVRNPEGTHQCRIISKTKRNANGYELFHNKIKKWIRRKSSITRVIMENIHKKFPRMDKKNRKRIFKEFLLAAPGVEEFRREFYRKINSDESNIELSSKEDRNEFFDEYYTAQNLFNPKSQGIECLRDDTNTNKIKSLHSNRCIIAYKANRKTGFENYADYLFKYLTDMFPKKVYFNKKHDENLFKMYTEFFPD
jgi:hypothetical protein